MASENSNAQMPNGPVASPGTAPHSHRRVQARPSRRRLLRYGLIGVAVVAAAGAGGFELVNRGVLPGKTTLDDLDGACSVPAADLTTYAVPGPERSGTFYSAARRQSVGYTIGYPPGHGPGDRLPLVVMLHGYGGNHADALSGMSPAQALALRVSGTPLPPMALVTADGGGGYWNPHPRDNPQAMLTDELIPLCQRLGLGTARAGNAHRIGVMGISMGGYGSLLLAEKRPDLISAVAAISPADLDQLRPGAGGQRRRVRVGRRLRRRRRGHPRRRARPRPGPRSLRLVRPLLPRRPDLRPRAAQAPRRRASRPNLRPRLPRRLVLHRPGTLVPRLPGPPPDAPVSSCTLALKRAPRPRPEGRSSPASSGRCPPPSRCPGRRGTGRWTR